MPKTKVVLVYTDPDSAQPCLDGGGDFAERFVAAGKKDYTKACLVSGMLHPVSRLRDVGLGLTFAENQSGSGLERRRPGVGIENGERLRIQQFNTERKSAAGKRYGEQIRLLHQTIERTRITAGCHVSVTNGGVGKKGNIPIGLLDAVDGIVLLKRFGIFKFGGGK